jgi:hypothetical protein
MRKSKALSCLMPRLIIGKSGEHEHTNVCSNPAILFMWRQFKNHLAIREKRDTENAFGDQEPFRESVPGLPKAFDYQECEDTIGLFF